MSTPQVPPQPNQDPQAVPPASGTGPPPYGPQPGYEAAPRYGAPPEYGRPSGYGPPSAGPEAPQYSAPPPYGPPSQYTTPGQYGMPVPPPAKNRKLLWIILGVAGAVLVLIVVGVIVLVNVVGSATNKARTISDDFTRLIVNGQSEQAYEQYMHPSLTQNLTKEDFVAGVAGLGLDNSCKPHYDSVNASSVNGTDTADVAGTLQCQGRNFELRYSFVGNDLKMNAIRLQPQG